MLSETKSILKMNKISRGETICLRQRQFDGGGALRPLPYGHAVMRVSQRDVSFQCCIVGLNMAAFKCTVVSNGHGIDDRETDRQTDRRIAASLKPPSHQTRSYYVLEKVAGRAQTVWKRSGRGHSSSVRRSRAEVA